MHLADKIDLIYITEVYDKVLEYDICTNLSTLAFVEKRLKYDWFTLQLW